jgi:hypothetical protein
MEERHYLTLGTLGGGAAEELFQEALQNVLRDIDNPNTEAKAKRAVTLTATFHPGNDRKVAGVEIHVDVKLAKRKSYETTAFMGFDIEAGRYVASEWNPKQTELELRVPEGELPRHVSMPDDDEPAQ